MPMVKEPSTRWAWVEIDQNALRRNTRAFKNLLGPRQRLCCVVKADAYGHGAVQCARVMRASGADMFAVATVHEGIELREGGINSPILILSEPPVSAIDELLDHSIMPSVYSSEFAMAYGERAVERGLVGRYHMAIETGMNRIGVHYSQVVEFRREIDFHRGLACDGVFTHFATADEPSGWDYKLQCKRFEEAVAAMQQAGFDCGIVHCDNTPASILDPSTHFDMIRAGIGLRAHRSGVPPLACYERARARDARGPSRHGRGRGLRLHVSGAACAGADLHTACWLCRRPGPRALESHGCALPWRAPATGGQYLHGPVHGGHPADFGA